MTPSNLDLEGSVNNLKKVMLGKSIENSHQSYPDKLLDWTPAAYETTKDWLPAAYENTKDTIAQEIEAAEARIESRIKEASNRIGIDFENRLREAKMGEGYNGGQTYTGGTGPDRKANLMNLRDTQPGKIQAKVTKAEFAHWRHCVEMFVDSANQWKGGSMILERLRVEKKEITKT